MEIWLLTSRPSLYPVVNDLGSATSALVGSTNVDGFRTGRSIRGSCVADPLRIHAQAEAVLTLFRQIRFFLFLVRSSSGVNSTTTPMTKPAITSPTNKSDVSFLIP